MDYDLSQLVPGDLADHHGDWEADSGEKWTVPVGGGIGKIFKIGKQSFNAQLQAFDNVKTPKNGPDWQLRFQIQLLFPE